MVCWSAMTWDRAARARQTFAFTLPLLVACGSKPATTQPDDVGSGATGGTSTGATSGTGTGATAGDGQGGTIMGQGGSSAAAGSSSGGDAGAGAVSGTGGSAAGAGAVSGAGGNGGAAGGAGGASGAGGSGGATICQELSVVPTPQVPTVMLVVDTSSSMWETTPAAWPILHTALMDPTMGVLQALQDKVRFGFESYKGTASSSAECAEFAKVDPAYANRDAIEAVYGAIDWPTSHPKWDTPTHYAIDTAVADLTAYMGDPPGKKYILLVTDGNPDTCEHFDPNCGHDLSIKAAQDAHAAGIDTYVLGVGDIVVNPNAGCSTTARCGLLHLQDLANAGVGAEVQAPPGCADVADPGCKFKYEQCNNNTLVSTYVETAPNVGTAYTVDTTAGNAPQTLITTLTGLLNNVISCTVEMDAKVTGDPSLGTVSVGGSPVAYSDPNGWSLDMTTLYNVTLEGAACETFKDGAELHISFPCDPNGNPIAVRR